MSCLSTGDFIAYPLKYEYCQWLDVYVPSIPQAGGFTITSAPQRAAEGHNGRKYVELAIQRSAYNPPAAFFWRPPNDILGSSLQVRVGGRFVYPPPDLSREEMKQIKKIVFVAGGVGINPIMSILEFLHLQAHLNLAQTHSLRLLYGARASPGEAVLFYDRIARIFKNHNIGGPIGAAAVHDYRMTLFLTNGTAVPPNGKLRDERLDTDCIYHQSRRMTPNDLLEALGPVSERQEIVAYVCGPPKMTDDFVEILSRADGMNPRRVLCEKWW